jgi:hypothetical protein
MQLSFNYLNYIVAWETLKIRYKPAKIRTNGVKALFHVFLLHQPSHQDLKAYVNKLQTHYKALQALNQQTTDTMILYLFPSKLDHDTQLQWKEK